MNEKIKKALVILANYRNERIPLNSPVYDAIKVVINGYAQVEEVEKAFKIIVEKDVDITCIKYFKKIGDYNVGMDRDQRLTQQEFRLTKKVVEKYGK